jgi:mannitol-1-phosphate 5-dehydrogenase
MDKRSIVIFGAGKIGRSFIGQVFGAEGYRVVFIDTDATLVNQLNRRGEYPVIIKGPAGEERIIIRNCSAIHASDRPGVTEAVRDTGIMAISVGKNALSLVAPVVADGLVRREQHFPGIPLDIILAENMRDAAPYFRERLKEHIPPGYALDRLVGLVETSIGKMVPIMSEADLARDPLQVFAEPYNTLILDRKGFRGEIPSIGAFALKDPMKAWVDRKAFIHNLGHATAAYCGYLKFPGAVFMYEVLSDPDVLKFTRSVMQESARVLLEVYPGEFTMGSLEEHIEDLLERFRNRNLGDTVFRVGCDLTRKLGRDDRFMGIIRLAQETGMPCDRIPEAMSMGFLFRATDEKGLLHPGDQEFHRRWARDPSGVLGQVCGLDPERDSRLIQRIKDRINVLKKG